MYRKTIETANYFILYVIFHIHTMLLEKCIKTLEVLEHLLANLLAATQMVMHHSCCTIKNHGFTSFP